MPTASEAIIERAKKHLLQNYRWQPLVITRGEGVRVWDAEGRRYLDMLGGIATCALGHCHPEVTAAAKAQLDRLWHISNVFYTEPQISLAEKLTAESGLERAFFCNSGAEANEALFKLARRVMKDRGHLERHEVVSFESSFHGRTLATTAATGQPKYQRGFEPLPPGFRSIPYGDLEVVKQAVGPSTAAIVVEAVQGEGGVRVAPEGFLRGLRELCDREGLLLLVDEVQTGMGRTGRFFAFQHEGVRPDAASMAKALGNGLPIAAMLCREDLMRSLPAGSHGSTFGGNLVAAAAANVAVSIIRRQETLERVRQLGDRLLEGAGALMARLPEQVAAVRGRGLLVGVEVKGEPPKVVAGCRERGMLVNLAGERTVRLAPPFVITAAEIDEALSILEAALKGV
ncbi:MAG: aspartate aminotransferase family protein [Myxococcales bacterium]|nr:aspartate aminotransferase family protein [Myxococcales bacterium]